MSWRTELMETKTSINDFVKRVENMTVGDFGSDVEAAIKWLNEQIGTAAKAVEIAENRYRIARAEHERSAAESRIAELES